MGQCTAQAFEPEVDVVVAGLDEAVGIEGEDAPCGQFDLAALEGQAAQTERRAGRQVEEVDGAVRGDEHGQRVAGAGEAAAAGHRVVDRVHAGGTEIAVGVVALRASASAAGG